MDKVQQTKPTLETPNPEARPLEVRHGRQLLEAIHDTKQNTQEAHRDVVATKSDTSLILDILTPKDDEPDPVLEAFDRLEKKIDNLGRRLIRIEKTLGVQRE